MAADREMNPAEIRERALSTAVAAKKPLYRLGGGLHEFRRSAHRGR
jgi:hypothetical protein